jgi:hypothetical protein
VDEGVEERKFHPVLEAGDVAAKLISAAFGLCTLMVADPQDMPPERCRRLLLDLLSQDLRVILDDTPSAKALKLP